MSELTPTSGLLNTIADWANANASKLGEAYQLKGGWEGWTQVELALYLKRAYGQQFPGSVVTVTREDKVYNGTNERSDLLLTTRTGGRLFTNMIELKCESIANSAAFPGEVAADCTKIDTGGIKAQYRPCTAWVVAFSISRDVGHLQVGGKALVRYRTIQAGGTQITMWTGRKDFT
ncbi:hypothetical protein GYMLUDRAFT_87501 [Collybiopsis luxurians FD-317 M1]|uniref:Uncharacterized protein n=1 Tax=Collybiopsis luxurians FD-317 M1 TaxID=944289 RepID=A0A0D0AYQ0_9AGAR|nr:hypothetical protein GYMLUDRAFT_87501 [Collybiopsis luxurians FD-317 M1]